MMWIKKDGPTLTFRGFRPEDWQEFSVVALDGIWFHVQQDFIFDRIFVNGRAPLKDECLVINGR